MLPEFRRILREDLPSAPDWVNSLITPINLFFEQVYNAMNRKLTIGDNVNGMVYQGTVSVPSNYNNGVNSNFTKLNFQYTGNTPPKSIVVGQISLVSSTYVPMIHPVSIDWSSSTSASSSSTLITVNYITGLTAGSQYTITLLCL